MRKKIPSPTRNASAPRRSNSKPVRSPVSAKRKSKKSSDDGEMLRVRTPTTSALRFLRRDHLVVPDEIPADEDTVPLDFTTLSNRDVGRLHSRYATRHAHIIYVAAKRQSRLANVKRRLRIEQAKFRVKNKGEFQNKYEYDDAMLLDDEIVELIERQEAIENELQILNAVAKGYEDFFSAASREISRRSSEQPSRD
jgi:hypothetical protein